MDKFKSADASVGSGKKATRESKSKCSTTSGFPTRSLFTSATSSSLASADQTDSEYIYKRDGGSIHTSDNKKNAVDVSTEYEEIATPESTHKFIIRKNKYKVVFEKVSIFPPATSSSHASEDQSDSDRVNKTKTDVIASNIPDSCNSVVQASTSKGKSATRESKNKVSTTKHKHKSTRSSSSSSDTSDSDWVCKTKSDVIASNIPDSENKVVQASTSKGKSATRESKNKLSTTKHKHKSTRGKKSRSTYVLSSSPTSSDTSDSDWVCKTKTDDVASNMPDSKNKIVLARASKGKSATRESKNKLSTTKHKHKSTRGKKGHFTYVPSSSPTSSDTSDSDWVCKTKTDDGASNIPESKNKIVLARASKGKSATRESKSKLSTTKHKHKSTRGRKSRSTTVPSYSLASSDPSGSGCKSGPVSRNSHNSKNKIVDAKAGPANVTRKWNNRMSPTRHKYKSVLKKRKRVATHLSGPNFASGSGSKEKASDLQVSPFIDLAYWRMTRICCGIVFRGLNGEVMVDTKLYKPCKPGCKKKTPVKETPQRNQSLDDTNINSSISSPNHGETDLNGASNLSITDTMGKEMDA